MKTKRKKRGEITKIKSNVATQGISWPTQAYLGRPLHLGNMLARMENKPKIIIPAVGNFQYIYILMGVYFSF